MGASSPQRKQSPLHQYAIYSNMAIEMGIVITLGVFGGVKLDEMSGLSPLFTLLCSIASIAIALYIVIRSITKQSKRKSDEQKNSN